MVRLDRGLEDLQFSEVFKNLGARFVSDLKFHDVYRFVARQVGCAAQRGVTIDGFHCQGICELQEINGFISGEYFYFSCDYNE